MDLGSDLYRWALVLGAITGAAWGVHIGGIGGLILGIVVGAFSGKFAASAILFSRAWGLVVGVAGLVVILASGFLYLVDMLWGVGRI